MSFLTAILGGLGGYAAGRQQRQQVNLQQQQYNQQEADRQRTLGMDEAKYRVAAGHEYANRGFDPTTARWNPTTFQYEGGTQFAMPKGYQQAPTDPVQAAQHFQRLLSIYAAQGRGDSDEANMAMEGYKTAMTQVTEKGKFAQQLAIEDRKFGQSVWLENLRLAGAQQGREYEAGQAMNRLSITENDKFAINHGNHLYDTWARTQPNAQMIYGAAVKTPEAALELATKGLSNLPGQITTAIAGLDKDNAAATKNPLNFGQVPNPNNMDFTNKVWKLYHQVVANPSNLPSALSVIKKQNDLYHTGQVDKTTGARLGISDSQANMATNWMQKTATTANAVQGAHSAVQTIQRYTFGPGGPGGGGAGAPPPFQPEP